MKKYIIIISILTLLPAGLLQAATVGHVVMSEIQIGATGYSTDEFVELYNPTDAPVDISGWQLIKRTASGGVYPLIDAFSASTIPAHGYFLVAHPTGYRGQVVPDARYTTVNSVSADNSVELVNSLGIVDVVGWGSATHIENAAAPTPGSGKSIERKALATSTKETMGEDGADSFRGNGEDTDHNDADWVSRDLPEPQNAFSELEFITAPAPVVTPPLQTNANTNTAPAVVTPSTSTTLTTPVISSPHTLVITEFLPDPKGADATEEFIEIFNTGDVPVELAGWKLQDASSSKYIFSVGSLASGAYRVVKRPESGIALNNTNGETVTLTAPDGVVVSSVQFTGSAFEGQSYALIDSQWTWTGMPTPGAKNTYTDGNHAPIAKIKDVETTIRIRTNVRLSAALSTDPDGDDMEFRWQFSDGGTATGTKVTHQFNKPGKVTVVLVATDAKGKAGKVNMVFDVQDFASSTAIAISAILPNPAEGGEEYVELTSHDSKDVDLAGWVLRNGTRKLQLEGVLPTMATRRIGEDVLPYALRNDGATLELLDPDAKVVSSLTYGKSLPGTVITPLGAPVEIAVLPTNTAPQTGKVAGASVKAPAQNFLVQEQAKTKNELPVWTWIVIGGGIGLGWLGYELYRNRKAP